MIIDLSEWNEFIAEDVLPGLPPTNTELEMMQIINSNSIFEKKDSDLPGWYRLSKNNEYPSVRLFWRVKKLADQAKDAKK